MAASAPAPSFRYDFYESDDTLYFTLYYRGIEQGNCSLSGTSDQVTITFKGADAVEHSLVIYPYGEVLLDRASIQYRGIKLSISFPKKVPVCTNLHHVLFYRFPYLGIMA